MMIFDLKHYSQHKLGSRWLIPSQFFSVFMLGLFFIIRFHQERISHYFFKLAHQNSNTGGHVMKHNNISKQEVYISYTDCI